MFEKSWTFSLEGRRLLLKLGIFVFNTLVFSVKYLGLSPDPNLQLALSKKTESRFGFIKYPNPQHCCHNFFLTGKNLLTSPLLMSPVYNCSSHDLLYF